MIDFFLTLGFYFHPFWRCCMDLKMQQFGVRFAEWLNWVFLISRLCLLIATSPKLKNQSDPSSLWGGRLARTQTIGRCRWGDYWWWVRNVDWRASLIPGAGFKVLEVLAQRGHDHAGIHRMSWTITIIGLSLFLSSIDSPRIPSVCFHEQRICFPVCRLIPSHFLAAAGVQFSRRGRAGASSPAFCLCGQRRLCGS